MYLQPTYTASVILIYLYGAIKCSFLRALTANIMEGVGGGGDTALTRTISSVNSEAP